MRVTCEIHIPFLEQTIEITFPKDMQLKTLVPLIFGMLKEDQYENIDIYASDGTVLDGNLNAMQANVVTGMKLYLI